GYGPGQPPMLLYGPYIDFIGAGYGLIAVLAALDFRRRTGRGQHIDLSQYEAGLQFIIPALLDLQANGHVPGPQANRDPQAAPHGVYPCRGDDAWCAIAVFDEAQWQALCRVAGHPDWAEDPRFATLEARQAHEDDLDRRVGEWTAGLTPGQVMEQLQAAGVPAGKVQTVGDLFSCPQLAHRRQWPALEHPALDRYEYEAPPFLLSETPAQIRRPSPCLGEHNDYVFGELLGLSAAEIERLKAEGVLA
ncbi:MAG: CaiB/BaiF CoA transferase family protein, partial [Anaerolineae bacterium]